ncbi:hypothetical protein BG003_010435 [Podila horticola]|nr:hypothetical protein BG003_010435 [Podila horticola]
MRHSSPLSLPFRVALLFTSLLWIVGAVIVNPKITSPEADVEWPAGSTQTIKWNTEHVDNHNATGSLVLGYLSDDISDMSEHLDYTHPLAADFKLIDGSLDIVIPNVVTRKTYIIVLFGDSGNASPKFTITNPNPPKRKRSRR